MGGPNHYTWPLGDTFDTRDYACSVYPQDLDGTVEVKSYSANGFGLYDTGGNVWEWCNDWSAANSPIQGKLTQLVP